MGLDGGTIPTRSDILRGQSWRLANNDAGAQRSTRGGQLTATGALATAGLEHRDRRQDAADGWAMCALAGTPLVNKPGSIVACELGHLYMRDSVIEFLGRQRMFGSAHCDRSALEREFGHIERLKDVFPVVLETAPPPATATWCCPLDRAILASGQHTFGVALPCGHAMRERSLALCMKSDASCPVCCTALQRTVTLFPPAEARQKRREELMAEREQKKARKRKQDPSLEKRADLEWTLKQVFVLFEKRAEAEAARKASSRGGQKAMAGMSDFVYEDFIRQFGIPALARRKGRPPTSPCSGAKRETPSLQSFGKC